MGGDSVDRTWRKLMRLLAFLLTGILAAPSFAQSFPDPIPGLQAAMNFCLILRDDDAIEKCVRLESAANWVTPEALSICRKQTFEDEKVDCLEGVVNRQIRPEEVQVCESFRSRFDQAQCLTEVDRPFPYVTRLKIDPQPGRDRASDLCRSFFFDDDKRACLQIISKASLYTVDSVQFCSRQFRDSEKLDCLQQLKDRFIAKEEVQACSKIFHDDLKLRCLQGVNRKFRLIGR
jgi:hypothetical protein